MCVCVYIYICWNSPFFVKAASANKWRVPLIFPKLGYTVLGYCTCHRCPFTKRQVEFSADLTRFGFVNEVSKIQCFFIIFPIKTLILGYTSFLDSHLTRWEILQASSVLEAEGEAGRKSHVG